MTFQCWTPVPTAEDENGALGPITRRAEWEEAWALAAEFRANRARQGNLIRFKELPIPPLVADGEEE